MVNLAELINPGIISFKGKVCVENLSLFWDSEISSSPSLNYEKAQCFKNKKLIYLQFFEDEIANKSAIITSIIDSRLGNVENKFAARKLRLKNISINASRQFFDANHLMGYKVGRTFGLYDKDALVCALAYKECKDHIEIERFCTLLNTSCAGGFGKLVSHLKQFNKPITSFCDLRYSDGHSYEAVGFKNVGETLGWYWTDGAARFNRRMCRATKDKTEKENAAVKGWFKIFDAGQRKYVLK